MGTVFLISWFIMYPNLFSWNPTRLSRFVHVKMIQNVPFCLTGLLRCIILKCYYNTEREWLIDYLWMLLSSQLVDLKGYSFVCIFRWYEILVMSLYVVILMLRGKYFLYPLYLFAITALRWLHVQLHQRKNL